MGRSIRVRSAVAARRIRWGVLCLPLAGLVYLESLVVTGEYILPYEDLRGYAEQITSGRFQASLLVNHLGVTLLLVGGFALYAYLTDSRAERWALAGLVLLCVNVVASGIQLGVDVPLIPAAQAYLEGQRDALDSVKLVDGPVDGAPLLLLVWSGVTLFLFGLLSNLFFGIAIWRSGTLPQGAAILWVGAAVLGVVLGVASFNPSNYLGVGIDALLVALDLGGSGWIAWSIWQRTAGTPVS